MPRSQTKKILDMIELIGKDEVLIRKFAKLILVAVEVDSELGQRIAAIVNQESSRELSGII